MKSISSVLSGDWPTNQSLTEIILSMQLIKSSCEKWSIKFHWERLSYQSNDQVFCYYKWSKLSKSHWDYLIIYIVLIKITEIISTISSQVIN